MRISKDPFDSDFAYDFNNFVVKLNGIEVPNGAILSADSDKGQISYFYRDFETGEFFFEKTAPGSRSIPASTPSVGEIEIIEPDSRVNCSECTEKSIKKSHWWTR